MSGMMNVTLHGEIDVKVKCSVCNNELIIDCIYDTYDYKIAVLPCEYCLNKKEKNGISKSKISTIN